MVGCLVEAARVPSPVTRVVLLLLSVLSLVIPDNMLPEGIATLFSLLSVLGLKKDIDSV